MVPGVTCDVDPGLDKRRGHGGPGEVTWPQVYSNNHLIIIWIYHFVKGTTFMGWFPKKTSPSKRGHLEFPNTLLKNYAFSIGILLFLV